MRKTYFKLQCICGEIIKKISVVSEKMCYRTDWLVVNSYHVESKPDISIRGNDPNSTRLMQIDREYFSGNILSVTYHCSVCGEVVLTQGYVNDFIRDSDYIFRDDLKQDAYGDLEVVDLEEDDL